MVVSGTATADLDYVTSSVDTTFPAGSMDGSMACLNVTIIGDFLTEGTEMFSVIATLNISDSNTLGRSASALVSIMDGSK